VAKVNINHVPYKGAGPMYLDLFSGRIELGAAVVGGALPHLRSGKVRGLGVTGAKRSDQLPEVPTIAEGGLPASRSIRSMPSWLRAYATRDR